jgi:nucleotide-binding universal stress UspA family protein
MAVNMAEFGEEGPAHITVLHVLPPSYHHSELVRAQQMVDEAMEGVSYENIDIKLIEGADTVQTILEESKGNDLIILPATDEPLFKNLLVGTMTERIARNADVTVIMVKRRSSPLHSFVRQAILEPTVPKPLE